MSKYFNDKKYCHCFDIPTSDGLGVCKDCRGYTNVCYSCDRCLHCWFTSQVELFTEYDEPELLAFIEKWNEFYQTRKVTMERKYFNDKRYCHCFDIPTSDGLGVCKGCRGYTNICYSCDRCLHCWFTSQVELFTEYNEPGLLALIEKWNKLYQTRKTRNFNA